MDITLRYLVTVVAAPWLAVSAFLSVGQSPTVEGRYHCDGVSANVPYAIHLVVKPRGKTYEFAWSQSEGGPTNQAGLGVPYESEIAVAIVSRSGRLAVAIYRVTPGRLEGVWTRGDGTIDTESCRQGDKDA